MNHEFDAISRLFRQRVPFQHAFTTLGNGDDASAHDIPEGFEFVISTDTAVESIHWPNDTPLDIAASRAVLAALSDLAAMGAEPAWVWLAVMAKDTAALESMSQGIVRVCHEHQLELAGGDTVRSPTNALNVTVGGLVPKGLTMQRSLAQNNDEIWLMGELGLSAAGLMQWQTNHKTGCFVHHFQKPTPQLKAGITLRKMGIQCCLDVSDGLLQDASHISKASQVAMCFETEKIQKIASYQQLQAIHGSHALELILHGGEDYALLFTATQDKHQQLLAIGAYPLGYCKQGHEVKLMSHGEEVKFKHQGYDHFA